MQKEKKIDVEAFITSSGANKIVAELKEKIAAQEAAGKPFIVSDVYDEEGNQYADLVQEGGGVWGIALLGYTYVLEQVGIRFFSMAGTSAGAINTMLLASCGSKQELKTEGIIKDLLELDLFSFVDGKKENYKITKWVKKIIQKFVLKADYVKRLVNSIKILAGLLFIFSWLCYLSAITGPRPILFWSSISAIFVSLVCIIIAIYLYHRIKSVAKTGYGLNAGDSFYKWISMLLAKKKVTNLVDLKKNFCNVPASLQVRRDNDRDISSLEVVKPPQSPMLVIVASDITTGNKVEFPRMWDMYWDNPADVPPAAFIRASMSIPIFFETYRIPISFGLVKVKEKWKDQINWNGGIPGEVQFVDGGVLSNFPINVFYNPNFIIPRMPTFGVRLGGDGVEKANEINSFGAYASSLLSTLRSTTDKNFINGNKAFTIGIKEVDMTGHSWLNFFMKDEEKQIIFAKGAKAAAEFILQFDWDKYKKARKLNYDVLQEQSKNPNNW